MMSKGLKLSSEFTTALERTCKRRGSNFRQTLSLLEVFFEECQVVVRETGRLDVPDFVSFKVQSRGGHLDKFFRLSDKGEKIYRKNKEGERLMIRKVKFPSVKPHPNFKRFIRGTEPISKDSEMFSKLTKK